MVFETRDKQRWTVFNFLSYSRRKNVVHVHNDFHI